jgi:hypothetical protein
MENGWLYNGGGCYVKIIGNFTYEVITFGSSFNRLSISQLFIKTNGTSNHVTGGQSIYRLKKLAYFDFLRQTSQNKKLILEKR